MSRSLLRTSSGSIYLTEAKLESWGTRLEMGVPDRGSEYPPLGAEAVRMSVSPCTITVRRSDQHGKHWSCTNKHSIKRLLLVASIASVLFSSNFSNVYAAGPYDGEWNGSARVVKNGRCRPANVTLTVLGNEAVGQAKFDLDVRNIVGTVRPDGTFGGTIGFQHLTGKFIEHNFEGAFQSIDCAWIMILRRTGPRTS
jgi:hypothetical protein